MKTLLTILFLLLVSTYLNAQSMLYVSIGVGQHGGTTAIPYNDPFISFKGFSANLEFEKNLQEDRSISLIYKYSNYNKGELLFNYNNSTSHYLGSAYNFIYPISETQFYEISPTAAYGIEKIKWDDTLFNASFFGPTQPPDSIKGSDKISIISLGLGGSWGYKNDIIVLKLGLSLNHDFLVNGKRNILLDTQKGDKTYNLNNPKYNFGSYFQAKASIGFILF